MSHVGEILLRIVVDLFFYTFCSRVGRQGIRFLTLNKIHLSHTDEGDDFISSVVGFLILIIFAVGIVELIRRI